MPELSEREKLRKELNKFGFDDTINCCVDVNDIVSFILEDRKRICAPLIKYQSNFPLMFENSTAQASKAIEETLKIVGLEKE